MQRTAAEGSHIGSIATRNRMAIGRVRKAVHSDVETVDRIGEGMEVNWNSNLTVPVLRAAISYIRAAAGLPQH